VKASPSALNPSSVTVSQSSSSPLQISVPFGLTDGLVSTQSPRSAEYPAGLSHAEVVTASLQPLGGGGVAYFAHIGGFLFGLVLIKLFADHPNTDYFQPRFPVY